MYIFIYTYTCVHLADVGLGAVAVAHHQATVAIWSRHFNISSIFTNLATMSSFIFTSTFIFISTFIFTFIYTYLSKYLYIIYIFLI